MGAIFDMAMRGLDIADAGRAEKKQRTLAELVGKAYSAKGPERQQYMSQAYSLDPTTASQADTAFAQHDERQRASLARAAKMVINAPEELRAGLWPRIVQGLEVDGITGLKPQWSPEALPMAEKIYAMYGEPEQDNTPAAIRELQFLQQNPQLAELDMKRRTAGFARPQIVSVPTGDGGSQQMVFDGTQFTKPNYGGAPSNFGGADQVQDAIRNLAGQFGGQITSMQRTPEHNREVGGVPNSQHIRGTAGDVVIGDPQMRKAYMAAAKGMGLNVIDEGDHLHTQLPRGTQIAQAGPLGYTPPKPAGGKAPPSGYRWSADGSRLEMIPGGPAQIASDARDAANAAKNDAAELKAQAAKVRQLESANTAGELVTAIDNLTGSDGFKSLGTAGGDFQLAVPFIRNDVKDAEAQLKNISGQVALATMSRLKALSAQGATGFGALSQQELRLLENSIASLQSDQISNTQLKASLKVIRDKMEKVSKWEEPAKQFTVGQIIEANGKKYRVTDVSDPNDPDVEEIR